MGIEKTQKQTKGKGGPQEKIEPESSERAGGHCAEAFCRGKVDGRLAKQRDTARKRPQTDLDPKKLQPRRIGPGGKKRMRRGGGGTKTSFSYEKKKIRREGQAEPRQKRRLFIHPARQKPKEIRNLGPRGKKKKRVSNPPKDRGSQ